MFGFGFVYLGRGDKEEHEEGMNPLGRMTDVTIFFLS